MTEKMPKSAANENERYGIEQALADITILKQHMLTGGRVDSEIDDLTRIIVDVRNGRMSPAEGVQKARTLAESRQEDH